eukprot:scaffold93474_cov18-Prasinocladus_malaysianus.AAC.1
MGRGFLPSQGSRVVVGLYHRQAAPSDCSTNSHVCTLRPLALANDIRLNEQRMYSELLIATPALSGSEYVVMTWNPPISTVQHDHI